MKPLVQTRMLHFYWRKEGDSCISTLLSKSRRPTSRLHVLCDDVLRVIGLWIVVERMNSESDASTLFEGMTANPLFFTTVVSSGKLTLSRMLRELNPNVPTLECEPIDLD